MRYLLHPGRIEVWARSMKYGPFVVPPVAEGIGGALMFDFAFQLGEVAVEPDLDDLTLH